MELSKLQQYVRGGLSGVEKDEVVEWIGQSEENFEIFASVKSDEVFSKLQDRPVASRKVKSTSSVLMRAAAFLLLPTLAFAAYHYQRYRELDKYVETRLAAVRNVSNGVVEHSVAPGARSRIVLPDSSVVYLNSMSRMIVPTAFAPDVRDVFLEGEAFFEVRTNKFWPMRVRTSKGYSTLVTGTTFNLSSYSDDDRFVLTLLEGEVELEVDATGARIGVKPNQQVTVGKQDVRTTDLREDGEERVERSARLSEERVYATTAWKDGVLVFDNTAMPDVLRRLERWYGVEFVVEDEVIDSYRLTATFSSESIATILDYLRISSFIGSDNQNGTITLFSLD